VNLLLLDPSEVVNSQARISGRRADHIRQVLRKKTGDALKAAVLGQGRAPARLVSEEKKELVVELGPLTPEPQPLVSLVVALPRPKALSRLLQTVASFGVRRLDLVAGYRVDKSYFDSPRLAPERLREDLWLGCEQGAQSWLPAIEVEPSFRTFIEERLPRLQESEPCRELLLDPGAARTLAAADAPHHGPVRLAVGPEGGWTTAELGCFERAGFSGIRLGAPILRTETAIVAALGQLLLLDSWAPGDEHPES